MINLLTLLTLSASSASSAVPAAVRSARVNELRSRLGLHPADAFLRGSLAARFDFVRRTYGEEPYLFLLDIARNFLRMEASTNAEIEAKLKAWINPELGSMLAWLGREFSTGIRLMDVPWEDSWRSSGRDEPYPSEKELIAHRMALDLRLEFTEIEAAAEAWARSNPALGSFDEVGWLFSRVEPRHTMKIHPSQFVDRRTWLDRFGWLGHPPSSMRFRSLKVMPAVSAIAIALSPLEDWFRQAHPDLLTFSFAEAIRACAAWHAQLVGKGGFRGRVDVRAKDLVLQTFEHGAQIVSLRTKKSIEEEGESMGHCVGGYWAAVRDKTTEIWSYRDEYGVPQVTMEVDPGTKRLEQAHGPEDIEWDEVLQVTPIAALRMARYWVTAHAPYQDDLDGMETLLLPRLVDSSMVDLDPYGRVKSFLSSPVVRAVEALAQAWWKALLQGEAVEVLTSPSVRTRFDPGADESMFNIRPGDTPLTDFVLEFPGMSDAGKSAVISFHRSRHVDGHGRIVIGLTDSMVMVKDKLFADLEIEIDPDHGFDYPADFIVHVVTKNHDRKIYNGASFAEAWSVFEASTDSVWLMNPLHPGESADALFRVLADQHGVRSHFP